MDPAAGLSQNVTRNGYRQAVNKLVAEGEKGVYYLDGSGKLGGSIATDFEAQAGPIAGCHVSNFAFKHFATYIGDKLKNILGGTEPAATAVQVLETNVAAPSPSKGKLVYVFDAVCVVYTCWRLIDLSLDCRYTEATKLGMEGLGWPGEASTAYGRLPVRAKDALNCTACKYTYGLSECSSGVLVRFGE